MKRRFPNAVKAQKKQSTENTPIQGVSLLCTRFQYSLSNKNNRAYICTVFTKSGFLSNGSIPT